MAKNGEIVFDPTQFEKIEGAYRGPSRASRPLQHPLDTVLSTPLVPVTGGKKVKTQDKREVYVAM